MNATFNTLGYGISAVQHIRHNMSSSSISLSSSSLSSDTTFDCHFVDLKPILSSLLPLSGRQRTIHSESFSLLVGIRILAFPVF